MPTKPAVAAPTLSALFFHKPTICRTFLLALITAIAHEDVYGEKRIRKYGKSRCKQTGMETLFRSSSASLLSKTFPLTLGSLEPAVAPLPKPPRCSLSWQLIGRAELLDESAFTWTPLELPNYPEVHGVLRYPEAQGLLLCQCPNERTGKTCRCTSSSSSSAEPPVDPPPTTLVHQKQNRLRPN